MRDRLIHYQRECDKVLAKSFQEVDIKLTLFWTNYWRPARICASIQTIVSNGEAGTDQVLLEAQLEMHSTKLIENEQRLEELVFSQGDTGRNVMPDQPSSQGCGHCPGQIDKEE